MSQQRHLLFQNASNASSSSLPGPVWFRLSLMVLVVLTATTLLSFNYNNNTSLFSAPSGPDQGQPQAQGQRDGNTASFQTYNPSGKATFGVYLQSNEGGQETFDSLVGIWHPDNTYAVHLDKKRPLKDHLKLQELLDSDPKYKENVYVMKSYSITYPGITILLAPLRSINVLTHMGRQWDFYFNYRVSEMPRLKMEDLQTLFGNVPRFVNFVESEPINNGQLKHRFGTDYIDPGLWTEYSGEPIPTGAKIDYGKMMEKFEISQDIRELPPEQKITDPRPTLRIYKGSIWVILSREFCDYVVNGMDGFAQELLVLFSHSQAMEESYLQTIIMNSHFRDTLIPLKMRYHPFFFPHNHTRCAGGFHSCDVTMVHKDAVLGSSSLFVAKIDDDKESKEIRDIITKEMDTPLKVVPAICEAICGHLRSLPNSRGKLIDFKKQLHPDCPSGCEWKDYLTKGRKVCKPDCTLTQSCERDCFPLVGKDVARVEMDGRMICETGVHIYEYGVKNPITDEMAPNVCSCPPGFIHQRKPKHHCGLIPGTCKAGCSKSKTCSKCKCIKGSVMKNSVCMCKGDVPTVQDPITKNERCGCPMGYYQTNGECVKGDQ
eukprot:Nk52_evm17s1916 gene=Nk52_evmTU17s1916